MAPSAGVQLCWGKSGIWGHIARHDTPARANLKWRNLSWWQREQRREHGLRHPARFSTLIDPEMRIQHTINLCVHPATLWENAAADREKWASLREAFIAANDVPWAGDRETALEDGSLPAPPSPPGPPHP